MKELKIVSFEDAINQYNAQFRKHGAVDEFIQYMRANNLVIVEASFVDEVEIVEPCVAEERFKEACKCGMALSSASGVFAWLAKYDSKIMTPSRNALRRKQIEEQIAKLNEELESLK